MKSIITNKNNEKRACNSIGKYNNEKSKNIKMVQTSQLLMESTF